MTAPDTFDVLTRLENQIINIEGVAEALTLLATSETIGNGREAISYLGNRLCEHHHAAREAFDEIFEAMKDECDGKDQAS